MSATNAVAVQEPQALAAPPAVDWEERRRLLRQAVMRNGTEAQVDVLMMIGREYDLNPVLKQIDLIEGQAYITHKGLWHIAHRSGRLDGIELVEQWETDSHHFAKVAIYRKDMSRPFTYVGRYPKAGRNKLYGPEMAVTRAECMALRRAFDVSLSVVEEIDALEADWRPTPSVREVEREAPPVLAASATAAGDLGWTEFWSWARARGYTDRQALDAATGRDTREMTPAEIKAAIEARAHDNATTPSRGTSGPAPAATPALAGAAPRTTPATPASPPSEAGTPLAGDAGEERATAAPRVIDLDKALGYIGDASKPLTERTRGARLVLDNAPDLPTLQKHHDLLGRTSLGAGEYDAHFRERWVALGGQLPAEAPAAEMAAEATDAEYADIDEEDPF